MTGASGTNQVLAPRGTVRCKRLSAEYGFTWGQALSNHSGHLFDAVRAPSSPGLSQLPQTGKPFGQNCHAGWCLSGGNATVRPIGYPLRTMENCSISSSTTAGMQLVIIILRSVMAMEVTKAAMCTCIAFNYTWTTAGAAVLKRSCRLFRSEPVTIIPKQLILKAAILRPEILAIIQGGR